MATSSGRVRMSKDQVARARVATSSARAGNSSYESGHRETWARGQSGTNTNRSRPGRLLYGHPTASSSEKPVRGLTLRRWFNLLLEVLAHAHVDEEIFLRDRSVAPRPHFTAQVVAKPATEPDPAAQG